METTKQDCINEFNRLASEFGTPKQITRLVWRSHSSVSEHRIVSLFGSFSEFKTLASSGKEEVEVRYTAPKAQLSAEEQATKYSQAGKKAAETRRRNKEANGEVVPPTKEEEEESLRLNTNLYHFNEKTNQYVIFSKTLGTNIVLDLPVVESLLEAYSNFDKEPSSINQICRSHGISRRIFGDIKKAMGWTHDSLPITNEQILNENEDVLVDDLVQRSAFGIDQKFKKRAWKNVETDAEKYRMWERGLFNPLKEFMDRWAPPEEVTYYYETPEYKPKGDAVGILIGVNDLHFGRHGVARKLFHHKPWDIEATAEAINEYGSMLAADIKERALNLEEVVVVSLGDILDSLTGETDKGTVLDTFPIGEEQFEFATNSLTMFLNAVLHAVPEGVVVKVKAVSGNHSSLGDWVLFKMLEMYFRKNDDIEFEITEKRWISFETMGSMITFEHGYSPFYRSKLPAGGTPRDNYIKDIMMRTPELFAKCKRRYFLAGDQHHVENQEYMHFEFIMLPALCGGSQYEDHLNLESRQRQKALIFSKDGLKEEHHYYFDNH